MISDPPRLLLRDLPLAVRLLLSAFLVSVALGYFSGLVQLHFQHAGAGQLLPDKDAVNAVYTSREGLTELERLITADETRPFNATGTMRTAFTTKSVGWRQAINKKARKLEEKMPDADLEQRKAEAEKLVRQEREAERLAVLHWIRSGARKETFEGHALPGDFVAQVGVSELNSDFFNTDNGQAKANIQKILEVRCARCHDGSGTDTAAIISLESWEDVCAYCVPGQSSSMSLAKLAQTTHVHLLGFTMLYGLTGLVFAFSSFPGLVRALLAPLPLLAQVVDISCWWLARADPFYAQVILYTGGMVAGSLALQIMLSLWDMGKSGKLILLLLLMVGGLGGWQLKERVIDPHLAAEKVTVMAKP